MTGFLIFLILIFLIAGGLWGWRTGAKTVVWIVAIPLVLVLLLAIAQCTG